MPNPIVDGAVRDEFGFGFDGVAGADPAIDTAGDGTSMWSGRSDPAGAGLDPPSPPNERRAAWLRRCWPAAWRSARVDPGRPGAVALALVAAAAAVLAAIGVWTERPRSEPVGGLPDISAIAEPGPAADAGELTAARPTAPAPAAIGPDGASPNGARAGSPPAAAPAPPTPGMVVSVSGKVRRPGLVEVPAGARVADALAAAGGALPGADLARLNLARRLTDGEQIAVGVPPAPDSAPAAGAAADGGPGAAAPGDGAGPPAPGAKIDLNAATVGQLDALPGVGPVTAQRILDWRTRNGRFSRVEQLREIEGIGELRFGRLRELVTV